MILLKLLFSYEINCKRVANMLRISYLLIGPVKKTSGAPLNGSDKYLYQSIFSQ